MLLCYVRFSVVSNSLQPYGLCSPPGSYVHGILQARILEWVIIPFSRGSSQPRYQTRVSLITGRFFTIWATREAPNLLVVYSNKTVPEWNLRQVLFTGLVHWWACWDAMVLNYLYIHKVLITALGYMFQRVLLYINIHGEGGNFFKSIKFIKTSLKLLSTGERRP